jgi:outer membrane receptor protein involved in Fe transport
MRKQLKSLSLILSLVFCLSAVAFGQGELAQLSGTVVDPQNAVVPGATVTVTSTRTGFTRSTTTNEEGFYILTNLQPSTYEISVKGGSFAEYKVTRELSVAAVSTENVTLSATTQQVVVDVLAGGDDVAEVNVTDQSVSEVVTNKQIIELPTITRNPYDFINTIGNVSDGENGGRGVGVAINGQRSASTSILLNGGENVDTFTASVGQSVPLDSVQEFRVVSGTFTADVGRATGGVVNLITKSGANRFFGSAYIFNRNSRFASAGFDANSSITAADRAAGTQARQNFNRNQFGGSLGGPIIKNKLLFFTNTELTRIRSTGSLTAFVPSAASIAASAPATRAFFAGYTLAATRTGRTASITAQPSGRVFVFDEVRYSVPTDTGAGSPVDGVQSANRVDWNVSDNVQVYGVFSLDRNTNPEGSNASSPYAGFNTGIVTDNTNIQVASTYSLSGNFVGTTRFTFNRLAQEQPLGAAPSGPTLYLRAQPQTLLGSNIAFPGYLPFSPGSAIPFGGPQRVYNLSQEFNYNIGNHLLKFGGQYYKIQDDRSFGAYQNAVETLGNSNSGAIENLFNGVIQTFQAAINPNGAFPGQTLTLPVGFPQFSRENRYSEFAVYGQDSFRLFPNFTANLGLRYEYYGPQENKDPSLDANFYFGGDGSVTPSNVRTGRVQRAPDSPGGKLWNADKNNFGPSVGFAYDIMGDGKSSVRAGYALRYERNFGNVTFNVIQNPPNYGVVSVTSANFGGTPIPITLNNAGPFAGTGGTVALLPVSLRAVDPNIVNAYAHQYSAAFERRFGQVTASAVFSGTTGKKLYSIANINRQGSGVAYLGSNATGCAGLAASTRLNCQYSDINFRGNGGYSSYQGITFSLESGNLFGAGLTMASRYTYSVSRDNLSTTFSETSNAFNLGFLDAYNPSVDYGFADFDVRHRFVTNFVWELPTGKLFEDGIGKSLFGGFTLSGLINVNSGTPFSVYDCLNGISTCTRLVPTGPLSFTGSQGADTGDPNRFVFINLANQTSFALPGSPQNIFPGENGFLPDNMTARNAFRGPGNWNVDLALSKRFFFTERMNLQLRVDAQNVFNHANLFVNGGEADISADDIVSASKFGRRQLQFGMRFTF